MQIQISDLLLLFVLAVAVSLIVALNVLFIVNKKLNNLHVNVPRCPVPMIYIQNEHGKIKHIKQSYAQSTGIRTEAFQSTPRDTQPSAKPPTPPSAIVTQYTDEHATEPIRSPTYADLVKSDPDNLIDTETNQQAKTNTYPLIIDPLSRTDKKTLVLRQGYHSTGADTPNRGDQIRYPDADDVFRYNGHGCYQDADKRQIRRVKIADKETPMCRSQVTDNHTNHMNVGFLTATGEYMNQIDWYVPRVYMGGDPWIGGTRYANQRIESPADVDQIGSIPVNNYDGEPVPVNSMVDTGHGAT